VNGTNNKAPHLNISALPHLFDQNIPSPQFTHTHHTYVLCFVQDTKCDNYTKQLVRRWIKISNAHDNRLLLLYIYSRVKFKNFIVLWGL